MSGTALFALELLVRRWDTEKKVFRARKRVCEGLQARYHGPRGARPRLPELGGRECTRERFLQASDGMRRPVVLRGVLEGTAASSCWSMEYFSRLAGHKRYAVITDSSGLLSSNTPYSTPERADGSRLEHAPHSEISTEVDLELSRLDDVLSSARSGGFKYVNNITSIFADCPRLVEDLELHRLLHFVPDGETADSFDVINMFMGGKGTGTGLHCAFAGNFFCNVVGRKRWQLIDPVHTKYLLPLPATPFIYSEVYFDPADPERNAFTSELPIYDVTLEPGDVLFNGPWWWHRVENLDSFTVGCAVRRMNVAADYANNWLFTLMSIEPLMSLLRIQFNLKKRLTGEQQIFRDAMLREFDRDILEALGKEFPAVGPASRDQASSSDNWRAPGPPA